MPSSTQPLWTLSSPCYHGGWRPRSERAVATYPGGQRQRLALARALLHSPDGLVLIDPTTSIDAVTTATIARKVRQLRAGRTTIIATTSPALLDQMDEVVLLDADGRQIARAPHRELLARDDYREMLS